MKRTLLLALCLLLRPAIAADAPAITPDKIIPIFNGKDLSNFDTWLVDLKHADPERVFTVVERIDGAPAIRSSGQRWGGIVTKDRYTNYKLVVEFRWGLLTWGQRKDRARDSGILLHCQEPFGNAQDDFNSPWMRSVEYQIIEGGTGDLITVTGLDAVGGKHIAAEYDSMTNGTVRVWKPDGVAGHFVGGRVNRLKKDPDWKDVLGYRSPEEFERPTGEWNLIEAICDGGNLTYLLNGKLVNRATNCSLREGKLLFQSEGAEIFFRKIELHPLKR